MGGRLAGCQADRGLGRLLGSEHIGGLVVGEHTGIYEVRWNFLMELHALLECLALQVITSGSK